VIKIFINLPMEIKNVAGNLKKFKIALNQTHISIHTIRDNADRHAESAESGTKVFVCIARLPQSYWNELYKKLWM